MNGGARQANAFLLARGGQMPNAGQGMPARAPIPAGTVPYGGPNATALQQQMALGGPATPVFNSTGYDRITTVSLLMSAANADNTILQSPPQIRSFLSIRNAKSSAGTVFIGFDQAAADGSAPFALPPGGEMWFDACVPQNDIHVSCDVAGTTVIVAYVNKALSLA